MIMPEFVAAPFVAKKREYTGGSRGPRPRSDEQKPWDEAFIAAWENNGIFAVQITPDEAEEAQRRVLSAARLNNLAVTEGEAQPGGEKGTIILSWAIRVPRKREPKATDTPS
jgi:hypothetical protein